MQDDGGIQQHVYMVDTHGNYPPVPRRSVQASKPLPPPPPPRSHGAHWCHAVVLMLLVLVICGMTMQAAFIYRLYYPSAATADAPAKMIADEGCSSPATTDQVMPSKPAAHLADGYDVIHGKEIMSWSTDGDSFLRNMTYKDGQLFVMKEGFYFIYSKVFFMEGATFDHSVCLKTRAYQRKPIELLTARKYSPVNANTKSNSYLGGVFHLKKGESIFVRVVNISRIIQHFASENFFGAFMI